MTRVNRSLLVSSSDRRFSNSSAEGLCGRISLTQQLRGALLIKQINLIRPQSFVNHLIVPALTARTWIRSGKQRDRAENQDWKLQSLEMRGSVRGHLHATDYIHLSTSLRYRLALLQWTLFQVLTQNAVHFPQHVPFFHRFPPVLDGVPTTPHTVALHICIARTQNERKKKVFRLNMCCAFYSVSKSLS